MGIRGRLALRGLMPKTTVVFELTQYPAVSVDVVASRKYETMRHWFLYDVTILLPCGQKDCYIVGLLLNSHTATFCPLLLDFFRFNTTVSILFQFPISPNHRSGFFCRAFLLNNAQQLFGRLGGIITRGLRSWYYTIESWRTMNYGA